MEALIQAESLSKVYGVVMGINDLTLELSPGVHGLLGPNGAGKSTFIKLITGQLKPTEGTIRVFGQDPWNNLDLYRRMGYCPEQDALFSFLTGKEFVTTLARLSGMDQSTAQQRASEALEAVGASDYSHRKISTYSKGMRQRTKVAQALVHNPDFIILDEPLSGTDPVGRREMVDLILSLGAQGKSILISSHVLHEVEAMTEDFLLIFAGRVLAAGNVHEIRQVMNEYPHRITIRCEKARLLAHHLMRDLPISGVELDEAAGSISILTQEPQTFYSSLVPLVTELDVRIYELVSQDDNLEAVFKYLVGKY